MERDTGALAHFSGQLSFWRDTNCFFGKLSGFGTATTESTHFWALEETDHGCVTK